MAEDMDAQIDDADPEGFADTTPDTMVELKKTELIEQVILATGAKKKDAKPLVEATLAALGKALDDGRVCNLQPLGKLMINRTQDKGNVQVMYLKLRRSNDTVNPSETLAEPED
ncbi:HU family DNA-binding protein [Oceaniovalibus sp. ACAM 378]|uniref:HU family DNA-binding protein n=1 Tax=Oceaniovalibus sp. ACAM 378 TaxID=2599923 RepID=UPI0021072E81|nr:HU family DNA-binding protein [Oceaniovalibus sp. ACAM 378]